MLRTTSRVLQQQQPAAVHVFILLLKLVPALLGVIVLVQYSVWLFNIHKFHLGLSSLGSSSYERDRRNPSLNVTERTKTILLYTRFFEYELRYNQSRDGTLL